MPLRAIIILKRTLDPATKQPTFTYLLRADVPVARRVYLATPGYTSPFEPYAPDTDPDASALVSGAVIEVLRTAVITDDATPAQMRARLVAEQAAYQQDIASDQTWARYGSYWNGSAWTAQGA